MSNVATILSRKGTSPISIDGNETVFEALKIMADKNIGSVVVKNEGKYSGIFTERDYSRNVILKDRHSSNTKVQEVMSRDLPAVNTSDTLEYCMSLLSEHNIKYLPVIENDEMSGIISISDVIREQLLQSKDTIKHLKNYLHG